MKKLIALLVVALFVCSSIVGCGPDTPKKTDTKPAVTGGTPPTSK